MFDEFILFNYVIFRRPYLDTLTFGAYKRMFIDYRLVYENEIIIRHKVCCDLKDYNDIFYVLVGE